MTLSLISVAIIFITALVIVIEVLRAIKRGRTKTLVTLASLFLAVFLSIFITNFLSNPIADFLIGLRIINVSGYEEKIPSISQILFAYGDAIISPILFLLVFFIMRILIAIVMAIVLRMLAGKLEQAAYENEEATDDAKHPKLVNALIGALCGFLAVMITIAPIMGTMKIVTKGFKGLNDQSALGIKIKPAVIAYFNNCSNDFVGNVIYYCGGNLIYKSLAVSTLNDNHFALESEIDTTLVTVDDLLSISRILNNLDYASEEEKDTLRNLGKNVDKSETLKVITADVLSELSENWRNDEPYEGASKPNISKICDTFFDQMLYVCTSTTPDYVGADMSTLLNVYIIAYESDILVSENHKEMIEKARETGAFEKIKAELRKNPRMAKLTAEIDNIGMYSIASALKNFNFDNYDALMGDITNVLNNAIMRQGQDRIDYIKNLTRDYIYQYGINIGEDVADEIAVRLADEVLGNKESVTVDDLKGFWESYANMAKGESNNSPTPQPPVNNKPQDTTPPDEDNDIGTLPDEDNDIGILPDEDPIETDEFGNVIPGEDENPIKTDEFGNIIWGEDENPIETDEFGNIIPGGSDIGGGFEVDPPYYEEIDTGYYY